MRRCCRLAASGRHCGPLHIQVSVNFLLRLTTMYIMLCRSSAFRHSAPIPTHIVLLANLWSSWAAPICRAVMPTPCSTTSRRWSYIHYSITTHWTMILPWCSSTDTSPGRQRLLRLFPSRTAVCRCRHHAWSRDGESSVMWVFCIYYISMSVNLCIVLLVCPLTKD